MISKTFNNILLRLILISQSGRTDLMPSMDLDEFWLMEPKLLMQATHNWWQNDWETKP